MARERSNITVGRRVEAVIEAAEVRHILDKIRRAGGRTAALETACERTALILHLLRKVHIDHATIRHSCEAIVALDLPATWQLGFMRLHVAKLEQALGGVPDPVSAIALAAWDSQSGESDTWSAYTDTLCQPVVIEIPAAGSCA